MEKQSKQLTVWKAVGIVAIIALVIVSILLVVSTEAKKSVKISRTDDSSILATEGEINTDSTQNTASSSSAERIKKCAGKLPWTCRDIYTRGSKVLF